MTEYLILTLIYHLLDIFNCIWPGRQEMLLVSLSFAVACLAFVTA